MLRRGRSRLWPFSRLRSQGWIRKSQTLGPSYSRLKVLKSRVRVGRWQGEASTRVSHFRASMPSWPLQTVEGLRQSCPIKKLLSLLLACNSRRLETKTLISKNLNSASSRRWKHSTRWIKAITASTSQELTKFLLTQAPLFLNRILPHMHQQIRLTTSSRSSRPANSSNNYQLWPKPMLPSSLSKSKAAAIA